MARENIIVIDDSMTICRFVAGALTSPEFQVVEAFDMESGLKLLEKFQVCLVLTDIFMPGMGGIEGIIRIREGWPKVKIIAISGGWDGMNAEQALAAAKKIGADAGLKKPFNEEVLVTTVEHVLADRPFDFDNL